MAESSAISLCHESYNSRIGMSISIPERFYKKTIKNFLYEKAARICAGSFGKYPIELP